MTPATFQDFTIATTRELERARAKHPNEEGVLTDAEWFAVLTEEVGECARAIQDEGDEELRAELAQVAAVAARWYASISHGRTRPPWAPSRADVRAASAPAPSLDDQCRRLPYEGGPSCKCSENVCRLRVGA